MNFVLDAGALIALDRGNRAAAGFLRTEMLAGNHMVTHGGVVGQVWRDPRRQVLLARSLGAVEVVDLGRSLGRRAGALLSVTGTSDVIDAALVLLATDGDTIVTSDPGDMLVLIEAVGVDVALRPI